MYSFWCFFVSVFVQNKSRNSVPQSGASIDEKTRGTRSKVILGLRLSKKDKSRRPFSCFGRRSVWGNSSCWSWGGRNDRNLPDDIGN
jgi:hypothetical protein